MSIVHPQPRSPSLARPESASASGRAFVLTEDPELGERLPEEKRQELTDLLSAETLHVGQSHWEPPGPGDPDAYGLLVLDGLLARQLRVGKALTTELHGPGDILRPWDRPLSEHVIPPRDRWVVLNAARLAVLDSGANGIIGAHRELSVSFAARLVRHSRSLAYVMAISHLNRVDDRLLGLLWHLASMWGRVTPAGVTVPFRLTHQVLGEVVGAQRPSVTAAMQSLQQRDLVRRGDHGGFVLSGDPPGWSQAQETRLATQ